MLCMVEYAYRIASKYSLLLIIRPPQILPKIIILPPYNSPTPQKLLIIRPPINQLEAMCILSFNTLTPAAELCRVLGIQLQLGYPL